MGREYTISTGMKIFYGLLAVGMFIFSVVLFRIPQSQSALLLLPLLILAGAMLIVVNFIKKKFIIYDDSIVNIYLFGSKEMAIADIAGCRIGQKVIIIESKSPENNKITLSNYIDFGDSEQLAAWFKENFTDLDATDLKIDEQKILNDSNLGFTKEDREAKLKSAKQLAWAYNIIGLGGSFLLLFLISARALIIMGLIYPLLSIPIMKFSNGLIKFVGNSKRSVNPFVLIGFMVPAMFMLFISLDEYQIFQYNNLWLLIGVVVAITFALIYFTGLNYSIGGIKGQVFMIFLLSAMYGFGGLMSTNCAFDKTDPTVYKATIIDHRIETGKHTSYLLTLSEWGPMNKQKEEDIGKKLYNQVSIGDTVKIYFKKGLFNAPWYKVKLN